MFLRLLIFFLLVPDAHAVAKRSATCSCGKIITYTSKDSLAAALARCERTHPDPSLPPVFCLLARLQDYLLVLLACMLACMLPLLVCSLLVAMFGVSWDIISKAADLMLECLDFILEAEEPMSEALHDILGLGPELGRGVENGLGGLPARAGAVLSRIQGSKINSKRRVTQCLWAIPSE